LIRKKEVPAGLSKIS